MNQLTFLHLKVKYCRRQKLSGKDDRTGLRYSENLAPTFSTANQLIIIRFQDKNYWITCLSNNSTLFELIVSHYCCHVTGIG